MFICIFYWLWFGGVRNWLWCVIFKTAVASVSSSTKSTIPNEFSLRWVLLSLNFWTGIYSIHWVWFGILQVAGMLSCFFGSLANLNCFFNFYNLVSRRYLSLSLASVVRRMIGFKASSLSDLQTHSLLHISWGQLQNGQMAILPPDCMRKTGSEEK